MAQSRFILIFLVTAILAMANSFGTLLSPERSGDRILKFLNRAGFAHVAMTYFPDGHFSSPNEKFKTIELSLVMFRDSGWSVPSLEKTFLRVSQIYSQCQLRVGKVTLAEMDPPALGSGIRSSLEHEDYQMVEKTSILPKPILYFVKGFYLDPSSALSSSAYTFPERITEEDDERRYTSWITGENLTQAYQSAHLPQYNTVAHELGHLLGNLAHEMSGKINLMSSTIDRMIEVSPGQFRSVVSYELIGDVLTVEQCQAIRNFPLIQ